MIDILKKILNYSGNFKDLMQGIFIIVSGILAIKGIRYINLLRKKRVEVVYGYWTHILIRLKAMKTMIKNDHAIINNLFAPRCVEEWTITGAPTSTDNILCFKTTAEETLEFMKQASDQLPAFKGWSENYQHVVDFIIDILFYDITDPNRNFKYDKGGVDARDEECKKIEGILETMINGIEHEQKSLEKKILKHDC